MILNILVFKMVCFKLAPDHPLGKWKIEVTLPAIRNDKSETRGNPRVVSKADVLVCCERHHFTHVL